MANEKVNREIKYVGKDFGEYRRAIINLAKNYFPNTYNDFAEASPAMMMVEAAAYVGDVLSFYSDVQLQESFLSTVNEKINMYNLAQSMGYKPKTRIPAQVDLDIFQLLPAIGEGDNTVPDFNYALIIDANMQVNTEDGTYFRTTQPVDFRYSSSYDPTNVSIFSISNDGSIIYYLLKKTIRAVEGELRTETFEFTDPKIYDKITLTDPLVNEIVSIVDSDGDTWHEVPYMAQDMIPISTRNTPYYDPHLAQFRSSAPFLLSYKQTDKRFVTRLRKDDRTELQFGSGLSQESDEEIIPNPYNVGIGLNYFTRIDDVSIDPVNFLYTKTYGSAPSDTVLTVSYALSSGLSGNVRANTIVKISNISIINPVETLDPTVLDAIKDSVGVNNPAAAYGGANQKPIDVIREEAMSSFAAQNRAVTVDDYILRCYTMPTKYGAIAKAYIEQDQQLSKWNSTDRVQNPYALNLYLLAYDKDKKFVSCNEAIKENLRQYLRQYRLMTDAINIKDPFIVNIGINYDIITRPNFNSYEVTLACTNRLIEIFDNDRMEIGSPIFLSNLYTELDKLEGVQTVQSVEVYNLYSNGYSSNVYDINTATRNNIIYPSMDPMVWEVRYPTRDIKGRVIDL